jgi:hypothetical protein
MNHRSHRLLLDPTAAEGGAPAPTPTPTPAPAPAADPAEGWKALLAKHHNDAAVVAKKLYDDNHSLRAKVRDLKKNAVPDGGIVLSGDDARAWERYRVLGKPEAIETSLKESVSLREERERDRSAARVEKAASAHGLKATVLKDLAASRNLDFEEREEKVNGKSAPVYFVKHKDKDGKDTETKLPDYVKDHLSDYLPSLSISEPRGPVGTPPRADPSGAPPSRKEKTPTPEKIELVTFF